MSGNLFNSPHNTKNVNINVQCQELDKTRLGELLLE